MGNCLQRLSEYQFQDRKLRDPRIWCRQYRMGSICPQIRTKDCLVEQFIVVRRFHGCCKSSANLRATFGIPYPWLFRCWYLRICRRHGKPPSSGINSNFEIVDDCFFLHERGAKIGYYTASLCLAGLAPVPAGYMLDSGTWRLLYYILAGLAGFLFVCGFFIVVETRFDRSEGIPLETLEEYAEDHQKLDHHVTHVQSYNVPPRKSYLRQLNPWSGPNHKASFWISLVRSFTYLSYPAVALCLQ